MRAGLEELKQQLLQYARTADQGSQFSAEEFPYDEPPADWEDVDSETDADEDEEEGEAEEEEPAEEPASRQPSRSGGQGKVEKAVEAAFSYFVRYTFPTFLEAFNAESLRSSSRAYGPEMSHRWRSASSNPVEGTFPTVHKVLRDRPSVKEAVVRVCEQLIGPSVRERQLAVLGRSDAISVPTNFLRRWGSNGDTGCLPVAERKAILRRAFPGTHPTVSEDSPLPPLSCSQLKPPDLNTDRQRACDEAASELISTNRVHRPGDDEIWVDDSKRRGGCGQIVKLVRGRGGAWACTVDGAGCSLYKCTGGAVCPHLAAGSSLFSSQELSAALRRAEDSLSALAPTASSTIAHASSSWPERFEGSKRAGPAAGDRRTEEIAAGLFAERSDSLGSRLVEVRAWMRSGGLPEPSERELASFRKGKKALKDPNKPAHRIGPAVELWLESVATAPGSPVRGLFAERKKDQGPLCCAACLTPIADIHPGTGILGRSVIRITV